jgi:hypothetical protein
MNALKQERRSTAEAVNTPLRLASGASPMLSVASNDSADQRLRATADVFIARYREFLSVDEHEQPAFDEAHAAFRTSARHAARLLGEKCPACGSTECAVELFAHRVARQATEHQAALGLAIRVYGTIALEWMRPTPKLTVISMTCESCGGMKQRADVALCLECADLQGALHHDDDTRDALPTETL